MRNGGGGGGGGGEEVKGSRSFEIAPRGTVQIPIRAHGEQREIAGIGAGLFPLPEEEDACRLNAVCNEEALSFDASKRCANGASLTFDPTSPRCSSTFISLGYKRNW